MNETPYFTQAIEARQTPGVIPRSMATPSQFSASAVRYTAYRYRTSVYRKNWQVAMYALHDAR